MIAIGLLNHARYNDEMQETLLMDVDSEFKIIAPTIPAAGLEDMSHTDGDYFSLLPEDDSDLDGVFHRQSTNGLSPIAGLASTATPESTPECTLSSSPDHLTSGREQELRASQTPNPRYGGDNAPATSCDIVQDLAGQGQQPSGEEQPAATGTDSELRVTKRGTRRRIGRRPGRPRAESTACIIAAYVNHEGEKGITSQEQTCIIDAMEAYQIAILRTPASCQQPLAVLVMSIGDSSALLLLKEAIEGLRSPQVGSFLCVDRQMSVSERLQIVNKLGCCTAFLKIVRWLHIVTLWEDLSQRAGDGANRFVLATAESFSQQVAKKGNPRYLARSEVAKGLSDIHSSQLGSSEGNEENPNTRLRRLGQRLGLMIRTWGQGILLVLGQALSDGRITTPTDRAFESLLALIDDREGVRIRAVSAAADSIVQDFRRGSQSAVRLRLESADEDAILRLPRLSTGFQALLAPLDEE